MEDQFTSLINQRNDADKVSLDKRNLVINAVKGDLNFGEDSPLCESIGYVGKSERRSGLTRKKHKGQRHRSQNPAAIPKAAKAVHLIR